MPDGANDDRSTRGTKRRRSYLRAAILLAIVLVGGLTVRLFGWAESLAYWPSRDPFLTPAGYEDVTFATGDGLTLHGWFMPPPGAEPPYPAVLHAHGNAGNVSSHDSFSSFLTDHGLAVLVFDYRGYGRSDKGRVRRRNLLEDTRAAMRYLRSRDDVDTGRIGVYAVSLGGAFALPGAAENKDVRAVVTLSTFSTWRGVARDWLPVLGPLLLPGGLDPVDALPGLSGRPMLIVHGDADEVINVRHSTILDDAARAAGVDVETYICPGRDHNRLIDTDPEARERIAAFFAEHLAP